VLEDAADPLDGLDRLLGGQLDLGEGLYDGAGLARGFEGRAVRPQDHEVLCEHLRLGFELNEMLRFERERL
jgi:hypothetical protein